MKIEVDIKKRYFFVILLAIIVLAGIFAVYAYSTNFDNPASDAATFGHSSDEIVVKMNDGSLKTLQELLAGGGGGGPTFITPVLVASAPGGTVVNWTTYNTSAIVPGGATAVILEAEAAMYGPDGGDVTAHIRIRANSASPSYVLLRGAASGGEDGSAWASQGIFPITAARTFQYAVEAPGFNGGFVISIIGYY